MMGKPIGGFRDKTRLQATLLSYRDYFDSKNRLYTVTLPRLKFMCHMEISVLHGTVKPN